MSDTTAQLDASPGAQAAAGVLVGLVLVPIFVFLSLGIGVPLLGTMVRYRADYQAKGLSRSEMSRCAPAATSFFGTMRRVRALEGWYGLYKGLYPMIALVAILSPFVIVSEVIEGARTDGGPRGPTLSGSLPSSFMFAIVTVACLPLQVVLFRLKAFEAARLGLVAQSAKPERSIVTPYRMPTAGSISERLRLLLTPAEYEAPFTLYTIPGLLPVTICGTLCVTVVTWAARYLIIGDSLKANPSGQDPTELAVRLAGLVLFRVVATLWLTPLDVLSVRLSLLPLSADGDRQDKPADEVEAATLLQERDEVRCSSAEDVVRRRHADLEPYTGVADCVKRIMEEEGTRALFRGWAWTALGGLLGIFG